MKYKLNRKTDQTKEQNLLIQIYFSVRKLLEPNDKGETKPFKDYWHFIDVGIYTNISAIEKYLIENNFIVEDE